MMSVQSRQYYSPFSADFADSADAEGKAGLFQVIARNHLQGFCVNINLDTTEHFCSFWSIETPFLEPNIGQLATHILFVFRT